MLTVITSVFNKGDRIRETVQSILSQSFCDFQYWVVDDGSTDNTWLILNEFDDPRLVLTRQNNRGFVRTMIDCMNMIETPYVAIQGAGDLAHPERLMKQLKALQSEPRLAAVSAGVMFSYPYATPQFPVAAHSNHLVLNHVSQLLGDNPINHGEVMIRLDAYHQVGGYRAFFRYAQDRDLWMRMLHESLPILKLADTLYIKSVDPLADICGNPRRTEQQALYSLFAIHCAKQRLQGRRDPLEEDGPQAFIDFIFSLSQQDKHLIASRVLKQRGSKTSGYREALLIGRYYSPNHPALRWLPLQHFCSRSPLLSVLLDKLDSFVSKVRRRIPTHLLRRTRH